MDSDEKVSENEDSKEKTRNMYATVNADDAVSNLVRQEGESEEEWQDRQKKTWQKEFARAYKQAYEWDMLDEDDHSNDLTPEEEQRLREKNAFELAAEEQRWQEIELLQKQYNLQMWTWWNDIGIPFLAPVGAAIGIFLLWVFFG